MWRIDWANELTGIGGGMKHFAWAVCEWTYSVRKHERHMNFSVGIPEGLALSFLTVKERQRVCVCGWEWARTSMDPPFLYSWTLLLCLGYFWDIKGHVRMWIELFAMPIRADGLLCQRMLSGDVSADFVNNRLSFENYKGGGRFTLCSIYDTHKQDNCRMFTCALGQYPTIHSINVLLD